jgi:hypothetical protein
MPQQKSRRAPAKPSMNSVIREIDRLLKVVRAFPAAPAAKGKQAQLVKGLTASKKRITVLCRAASMGVGPKNYVTWERWPRRGRGRK